MTCRARPVNGIMIAGMDTPELNQKAVYPREFGRRILSNFPDFEIEPTVNHSFLLRHYSDPIGEFINRPRKQLELQLAVIRFLSELEDWDLFVSVVRSPDSFQHAFWQSAEKAMAGIRQAHREASQAEAVFDCYKRIDSEPGWWADGERNIILMSDHGFGELKKEVCTNKVLAEAGLLSFRRHAGAGPPRTGQSFLGNISQRLPPGLRAQARDLIYHRLKVRTPGSDPLAGVDWDRTKVYSFSQLGCLFANLKGRKPADTVSGGKERLAILAEAKKALAELSDPEDDAPVVTEFKAREELYSGSICHTNAGFDFCDERLCIPRFLQCERTCRLHAQPGLGSACLDGHAPPGGDAGHGQPGGNPGQFGEGKYPRPGADRAWHPRAAALPCSGRPAIASRAC